MTDTLVLILGQTPEEPVRWASIEDGSVGGGAVLRNAYDLTSLSDVAEQARRVIAVLPGEQAASRPLASPPRAASKFKAAAAYLLEDELAEGLGELHIATTRHASGNGLAFAVKKGVLTAWRDVLDDVGVTPDIIAPDFALLPCAPDQAVVVLERERAFGAVGFQGFALERPMADAVIAPMLAEAEIGTIAVYADPDTDESVFGEADAEWRGHSDDTTLFEVFAGSLEDAGVVNLLQGDFRRKRDWRGAVGPWRRAAVLAAACFVGLLGASVADAMRSDRVASALEREARELHNTAFPDQTGVDPRDHARRILGAGGAGPSFLPLTAKFADSLAENDAIQVDRIRYNAARSEFSINVRFADINDLEALKQSLANRGVNTSEAGGVRRSGGFYVGELRVGRQ